MRMVGSELFVGFPQLYCAPKTGNFRQGRWWILFAGGQLTGCRGNGPGRLAGNTPTYEE